MNPPVQDSAVTTRRLARSAAVSASTARSVAGREFSTASTCSRNEPPYMQRPRNRTIPLSLFAELNGQDLI
jgi:hypothetical protein